MMAAGHGLEADLRCMLESHVPLSRLSRMSGRHIYRGRGTPIARSGGELERGGMLLCYFDEEKSKNIISYFTDNY